MACQLIRALKGRGFSVAALKHSHTAATVEPPASDTSRLKNAGASPTLFLSDSQCLLFFDPPKTDDILNALLVFADFVVVEGLKSSEHPKIVVGEDKGYLNVLLRVDGCCSAVEELAARLKPSNPPAFVFTDKGGIHLNPFVRGLLQSVVNAFLVKLRGLEGDRVVILTRLEKTESQKDTKGTT